MQAKTPIERTRPAVGLLFNPATPDLVAHAPELVEYLAIMPDRLWYDFGPQEERRFHRATGAMEEVRRCAQGRLVSGHGLGLSLPSAAPFDEGLLDAVAEMSSELGFRWYSEHLSVFIMPKGGGPNARAALGLPVTYDRQTFEIVRGKLRRLREALDRPVMLENGSFFAPCPDMEMSEPGFLNRLHREEGCGTLLDLHNLYVSWRNGGIAPEAYLEEIDPEAVMEIHLGGGHEADGFYLDSHSGLTPADVWRYAFDYAPRFRNLRAVTFEFHESYYDRLGADALVGELKRMHELAAACARGEVRCEARELP